MNHYNIRITIFLSLIASCWIVNTEAHNFVSIISSSLPSNIPSSLSFLTNEEVVKRRHLSLSNHRNNNNNHNNDIFQIVPRGGSLTMKRTDEDEVVEEESNDNIVVTKIRNIIRSLMEIGEKKSPIMTKVVKLFVKSIEKVIGIKLLPDKKKKLKHSNDKKKKVKSSSATTKKEKKEKKTNKSIELESNDVVKNVKDKKKSQQKNSSGAAQAHLAKDIKSSNPNYRIQRELKEFIKSPPPNLSVKVGKNIRVWIITMVGTKGSLYEGETYRLKVTFPSDYPTAPPSVYFLQPTPRHEHVYTNGDICLSLLGKDWRPTMTAQSIANSILSILSGASRKSLPMDNVAHAKNKPGGNQDNWIYHDDNC